MTQPAARQSGSGEDRPRLGELLVARGVLTDEQLREALSRKRDPDIPLGRYLVESGYVTGPAVAMALADQQGGLVNTEYGFATGHGELPAVPRIDLEPAPAPPLRLAGLEPEVDPGTAVEFTELRHELEVSGVLLPPDARRRSPSPNSGTASSPHSATELEETAHHRLAPMGRPRVCPGRPRRFFRVGDRYDFEEREGDAPAPGARSRSAAGRTRCSASGRPRCRASRAPAPTSNRGSEGPAWIRTRDQGIMSSLL